MVLSLVLPHSDCSTGRTFHTEFSNLKYHQGILCYCPVCNNDFLPLELSLCVFELSFDIQSKISWRVYPSCTKIGSCCFVLGIMGIFNSLCINRQCWEIKVLTNLKPLLFFEEIVRIAHLFPVRMVCCTCSGLLFHISSVNVELSFLVISKWPVLFVDFSSLIVCKVLRTHIPTAYVVTLTNSDVLRWSNSATSGNAFPL